MIIVAKGLLLGLSIAAPVGPIGILCINRTLFHGRKIGLATGLGAACADAIYACVAGLGLTWLSNLLLAKQFWLGLVGGFFLIYLGIKTLFKRSQHQGAVPHRSRTAFSSFVSSFFLTLSNPMTIMMFVAIFAGIGIGSAHTDYQQAVLFIISVFLGSLLWWIILVSGVSLVHHQLSERLLKWINDASGLILLMFGLFALWRVLTPH